MAWTIWMVHPNGSRMPVHTWWTKEENLKNGWVVERLERDPDPVEEPVSEPVKRRGRPPKGNYGNR